MKIHIRERFSGCLIGQCLGDALGFPLEGYSPEECDRYVREVLRRGSAGDISRLPYSFGQYTDDSQLARELLQSYVSCGCFDPEDYAKRIASIFKEGHIVGIGRATEEAAIRLLQNIPWHQAGTPPPSAGNGSAMRAAPVGLMFYDKPQELIRAAHDQGRITHRDRRCSAGAVAIAGSVALAIRMDSINTHDFILRLSEWVGLIDSAFASYITHLQEYLKLTPEKAIEFIANTGMTHDYHDQWQGISPFVIGSVLWSLYAFLRSPDDYWETICTAIQVGGDVDTTAAMAGAISGTHLGLSAIPRRLASKLTDQGKWGYEDLLNLSEKAYETKMHSIRTA
jgi:ADP-ribosylglycohydrolase